MRYVDKWQEELKRLRLSEASVGLSDLTQAERDKLPDSDFADPKNRKFPIVDGSDVGDAWSLAGHAEGPDAVRRRIVSIAKRKGLAGSLPDTAREWCKEHKVDLSAQDETEERERFATEDLKATARGYEAMLITAGNGNQWEFPAEALRGAINLFDGAHCFLDHGGFSFFGSKDRSLRDLVGVFSVPQWDEEKKGIRASLTLAGPCADMARGLADSMLKTSGGGPNVRPRIGFSADFSFKATGRLVKEVTKVHSVDLVYSPARGGEFLRELLNSQGGAGRQEEVTEVANSNQQVIAPAPPPAASADAAGGGAVTATLQGLRSDVEAVRSLLDVQAEQAKISAEVEEARKVRAKMCEYLLETGLSTAKLPVPLAQDIRERFAGKVFSPTDLTDAIEKARVMYAQLTAGAVVSGPGGHVSGMYTTEDQLQLAVEDLLEAPRDAKMAGVKVHRLTGIRELYHLLTGDYDLQGGFYPARVRLATTSDFTGLVKNALNKIVVNQWQKLGRAGYEWWKAISTVEHFTTLNSITGTLVGSVGALPTISEGAEYTELVVGDSPETASFVKYGGYIPLTLELIDRDETRKLKQYPKELANAALRRLSALVAAIFTDNSGVGPTLADTGALFNATAITTAGGHVNLLTTALAAAEWEVVSAAVYNQPLLIKNATGYYGTGAKMAINPRYLLVPRVLQLTALKILYPTLENASNIYSENMQRGQPGDVLTVPEWTDATDWAAVCDPDVAPAIYVGERFGLLPEIVVAGQELSPAVFMNDEHRLKVRHFLAVWVNDFRPLHKSNVAG